MRIVSLIPSATEIVYALGLEADLVGVTFECDFPPDPRPTRDVVVGGLDTHGLTPAAIDAMVRTKVAAGEDLYRLNEDRFRACDPHTLDEVVGTILEAGRSLGVGGRAEQVVADLRARIDGVALRCEGRHAPSVFVLEWCDPPFLSGHWVPDLVVAAGASPVLAEAGGRSVPTEWATIAEHDPDIVIVAPCGFGLDGAADQAAAVLDHLPARAQVWAIDADGLVVRPGPRLVDGIEALATIFHPDEFDGPHLAVRRIR